MRISDLKKKYKAYQVKKLKERNENLKILRVKAKISEEEYKLKKKINKGKTNKAKNVVGDFFSSEKNNNRLKMLR